MVPGSTVVVRIQGLVPGAGYEVNMQEVLGRTENEDIRSHAILLLGELRNEFLRQPKTSDSEKNWNFVLESLTHMKPELWVKCLEGHVQVQRSIADKTSTAVRQTDGPQPPATAWLTHTPANSNAFGRGAADFSGLSHPSLLPACVSGMPGQRNCQPYQAMGGWDCDIVPTRWGITESRDQTFFPNAGQSWCAPSNSSRHEHGFWEMAASYGQQPARQGCWPGGQGVLPGQCRLHSSQQPMTRTRKSLNSPGLGGKEVVLLTTALSIKKKEGCRIVHAMNSTKK